MRIACITPDRKHDYLVSTVLSGLKSANIQFEVSNSGNGCVQNLNDYEFIQYAKDCDYIFAFFGKVRDNSPPKYNLLNNINAWEKVAYIDGSEWTATAYPLPNQVLLSMNNALRRRGEPWINDHFFRRCKWYFKRECYPDDIDKGIVPLPFGIVQNTHFDDHNRHYDLFTCFGQLQTGLRSQIYNCEFKDYKVFKKSGIKFDEYINNLKQSKIGIDAWGGGDCNARLWEIIGQGAVPAYQKWNIVMPYDFEDMKNCIKFDTIDELNMKLRTVLSDYELFKTIQTDCWKHAELYHTAQARVQYMFEVMK